MASILILKWFSVSANIGISKRFMNNLATQIKSMAKKKLASCRPITSDLSIYPVIFFPNLHIDLNTGSSYWSCADISSSNSLFVDIHMSQVEMSPLIYLVVA
jgi:hypothetical protein